MDFFEKLEKERNDAAISCGLKEHDRDYRVRKVEKVNLIKITSVSGSDNEKRAIVEYWTPEGERLCIIDPLDHTSHLEESTRALVNSAASFR